MPYSHLVDTVTAWFALECLVWTIVAWISVVTNGNRNLMPTISPFGISDKTLISQIICTSKEFWIIQGFLCTYIHNEWCAFICYKQVSPPFLLFCIIPPFYYLISFLLYTYLSLYLLSRLSDSFIINISSKSLPLFFINAKGLYEYTITRR